MDLAFGFLMLLWGLLGRGRTTPEQAPRTGPSAPPRNPPLTSTPPWPAVIPEGLPPFPGSGWEYDEPPPQVVQKRAGELVQTLWDKGKGTYKIEQTAGRWIAYQAGITAGNRHGVIAYRQKRAGALPASRPATPRAVPPSAPSVPGTPANSMPPGSVRVTLPGGALGLPTLRYGRGLKPAAPDKDVMLLQQKLGITADGRFGNDTRAAVSKFQAQQAVAGRPGWKLSDIDGVVGPQTWTALFAVRA